LGDKNRTPKFRKKEEKPRSFLSFIFIFIFYFSPKSQKYQIQTRLLSFSLQALDIHKKRSEEHIYLSKKWRDKKRP
jgi:hypothetical protein